VEALNMIVGTVKKIIIGGITYAVPADVNLTVNLSSYVTEGMPTSGDTVFKKTKRVPTIEGADIITSFKEAASLKTVAESLANTTLAVVFADNTTYRSTGQINFENFESETGRSKVTLIPSTSVDPWTVTP